MNLKNVEFKKYIKNLRNLKYENFKKIKVV